MTIATRSRAGVPWCRRVLYAPDEDYNLYWMLSRGARISQNIRANPSVAIMIYEVSPTADAVYAAALAVELSQLDEVEPALEILRPNVQAERRFLEEPANLIGDGHWRLYRASPQTIEVRGEPAEGADDVVLRQPADFRDIRISPRP